METIFDSVVAAVILLWAFASGVLPGLDAIGDLPSIDWSWPIDHPRPALVVATVWLTVIILLVLIWSRRVRDFRDQVRARLRDPPRAATVRPGGRLLAGALVGLPHRRRVVLPRCVRRSPTARNVAIVLAVQSLSTLLPFTPGGIGTQQGFLVYAFRDTTVGRASLCEFQRQHVRRDDGRQRRRGLIALLLIARTLRWKRIVEPEKDAMQDAKEGR